MFEGEGVGEEGGVLAGAGDEGDAVRGAIGGEAEGDGDGGEAGGGVEVRVAVG